MGTAESGFYLLEQLVDTRRLVVVDSIVTGNAAVGSIHLFREDDLRVVGGGSPHYVGLFECLALARELHLRVAEDVVIVAVEIGDDLTLGGEMHPALTAAIPKVIAIVRQMVTTAGPARRGGDFVSVTLRNRRAHAIALLRVP